MIDKYVKENPRARSEAVRAALRLERGTGIYALNKLIAQVSGQA